MTIAPLPFLKRQAPGGRLLAFLLAAGLGFLGLYPVQAQTLSLRDQAQIKYQAQLTLLEYESILNLVSNGVIPVAAVNDAIHSAYHDPNTRIFYSHEVPVQHTIVPSNLSKAEIPSIRALDFIRTFNADYVKSELETVDFWGFELSDLKQGDYLYLLVKYSMQFKGRHKTDPALYKAHEQVAELRVEKRGEQWVTYIKSVTGYDPAINLRSEAGNVTLAASPADDGTFASKLAELLQRAEQAHQTADDAAIARSWQAFDEKRFQELRSRGQQAEGARDYTIARLLYRQALQLKAGDAATKARLQALEQKLALYARIESRVEAGAYLEAIQAYGKAISDDPKNPDLYLGRGKAYEKLNELQTALQDFSTAIQLDAQYAEALHQRARLYERNKEPQKALADYNQIIEKAPNGAAYYPDRARLKQALGDHSGALADYEAALKQTPGKALLHYEKGMLLQQQNQAQEAIAAFSEAIAADSLYASAYYARGLAYSEQENTSAAAGDFQRARAVGLDAQELAAIDQSAVSNFQAGQQAMGKDNPRLALQHFIKAVLISPGYEAAWVGKGDAHLQLKDYENAIESYSSAIALEKPSLAYYNRGMAYRELNEPAAAKSDFERFVPIGKQLIAETEGKARGSVSVQRLEQIAQEVAEGWYRLGNAQLLSGQYAQAQTSLDQTLAINKGHAPALFAQGAAHLGLKNYKKAIRDIEKSMKWGIEDSPWVYLALGDAYLALGQAEYAVSIYTYILESVDQDFEPAYLRRSDSYKQMKQYQLALQDITAALARSEKLSRNVELLTRKGLLELHEAKYGEAGQTFDSALRLESNDAWALYGKASVLASQNKMDESLELYRRAFQSGEIEWSAIKDDPIIKQVSKQKAFKELVAASLNL
jgi:tetratricopeptide (TPR) repeat protein